MASKQINPNLRQLREEPWFQDFVERELIPGAPRPYQSSAGDSAEAIALEAVRRNAMRDGYRYCLNKLGLKLND